MTEKDEEEIWVDVDTIVELRRIIDYLHIHGVNVTASELISSSLKLTRRLGAGDWTFVCHFREEERMRRED